MHIVVWGSNIIRQNINPQLINIMHTSICIMYYCECMDYESNILPTT